MNDMKNVQIEITNNQLVITVDLREGFGPSKSGKTEIIASSCGNQSITNGSDIKIGLNVYRPIKQ